MQHPPYQGDGIQIIDGANDGYGTGITQIPFYLNVRPDNSSSG
jgi:hypothetical protein